jgi:hypothetical protein
MRGGNIELLGELLGVDPQSDLWQLALGWAVGVPFSDIARPMLWCTGVQGSGKSTRGWMLASIWDPCIELGSAPGKGSDSDRALAMGRYVVGFDNITKVDQETSDFLCRMITGAGDSKRQLYSDNDLLEYHYRRTAVATSLLLPTGLGADAQERAIHLPFQRLAEGDRRSERNIRHRFAMAHELILGALLDLVVGVLGCLEEIKREEPPVPRMADYAYVLKALDTSAETRTFEVYREEMHNAMATRAADDPFVGAVMTLMDVAGQSWRGTAGELLSALGVGLTLEQRMDKSSWMPRSPRHLVAMLTRAYEPLRAVGIVFEQDDRPQRGSRRITLQRVGDVEGGVG